jgi:hypothetical protein
MPLSVSSVLSILFMWPDIAISPLNLLRMARYSYFSSKSINKWPDIIISLLTLLTNGQI